MAPIERNKTSDAVVEHVIDAMFSGRLASGERVDLDALATEMGISRGPVREAMVLLERDGLVDMPLHRGAYVADFNSTTVTEAFDLYALLCARTSALVATHRDEMLLAVLEVQCVQAVDAARADEFETRARRFRRTVNRAVAGPHLKALLRTFGGLVPAASRLGMEEGMVREQQLLRDELQAFHDQDAEAAATAAIEHIELVGRRAVRVLVDRGVLASADEHTPPTPLSSTWLTMATLETTT